MSDLPWNTGTDLSMHSHSIAIIVGAAVAVAFACWARSRSKGVAPVGLRETRKHRVRTARRTSPWHSHPAPPTSRYSDHLAANVRKQSE